MLSPGSITVTDAFSTGDTFEVFDFGVSLGLTSTPGAGDACGGDTTNPALCALDGAYSHATFALGAGSHEITIQVVDAPFGSGAGFFLPLSAVAAPEPGTLLLVGAGLAGLGATARRRRA